MKLTSPVFQPNQPIPSKYTCDGDNINPPLKIADVPGTAKSLALIMDDPDAPAGNWDHWLVFNIDPQTTEIAENSVPDGVIQGKTDFGDNKYGGPCPGQGQHRYFFKLYALDANLDLKEGATKAEIEQAMDGHILDQTELVGIYQRQA